MTALDDAAERLQKIMTRVTDAAARSVWAAFSTALPQGDWNDQTRRQLIAELTELVPDVVDGYVGLVAEQTLGWYDALAPDEPYTATLPDTEIVPTERILESIGWAVRTATSAQTALAQLTGTVDRAVMDAQRAVVAHNAATEGVRYRRHTNYAGACDWCLVMATRGAVYISAASAVRGHDNCRCLAVPERPGASYTTPAMVTDAQARYAAARKELEAEGITSTLDGVLRQMAASSA